MDAFDAFMAPALMEYKEKPFRNIDDAALELPETAADSETPAEETPAVPEEQFTALAERVKEILGERVAEVRPSKLLKDSPVRLVSPENSPNHGHQPPATVH